MSYIKKRRSDAAVTGRAGQRRKVASSSRHHRSLAARQGPVAVAIVTVSDSRTEDSDINGTFLKSRISRMGHRVGGYRLVKDEPDQIARILDELADGETRVIIFNGGTGISPRDTTFDILSRKLEKSLPGFGEIFRLLSYQQIGSAAMLSRACAGIYRNRVIFSTPGSPDAVKLAWNKLIAPELSHLAWEIVR